MMMLRASVCMLLLAISAYSYADDQIIDLGLKGQQLGQTQTTHLISLHLNNIPTKASIEMSFVVLTTGICPISYFPTEIYLNGESIAEIDFRELDEGSKQALNIELPARYQQQGNNEIKIVTGDCNESLDSLRFNNVALRIEKPS